MAIYLDNNATTLLDERVLAAMLPYLQQQYGNPSEIYTLGREARQAIDIAREQVAQLMNVQPAQIIFTSGGTEANNWAVKHAFENSLIHNFYYSAIEHASIIDTTKSLAKSNIASKVLPVTPTGLVDTAIFSDMAWAKNTLTSIMWANNETGVIQDIPYFADKVRQAGGYFHCDAVQAIGKINADFSASLCHTMSISAHKIHGPKGVGALIIDRLIDPSPLIHGGKQERGYRSGTENVAGIVGFGQAAEITFNESIDSTQHCLLLQKRLENKLEKIPGIKIFSKHEKRLPNTSFFALEGIDGESMLMALDTEGIAVASGSACSSMSEEPSHVLLAMGVDEECARGAIRISLSKHNTDGEIDKFIEILQKKMAVLRSISLTAEV